MGRSLKKIKSGYIEQGTEYDELIKVKGQWFIKKRSITADSGLSGDWPTYKPRSFR
jgi:hypothetical protein